MSVQPRLPDGDAAHCIVSCAQDTKVDLIMMPTHGYGPFRRLLLGSVTAKVLHDVASSVWTGVHTDEMWSQLGGGWNCFLCALDGDQRDIPMLKWAAQFACEQHAQLQVVHAVRAPALVPGADPDSQRDLLLCVARERLNNLQAYAGTNVATTLAIGPVDHVVRQAALEHRADLILIGKGVVKKGLGGLGSNAYAVIREAPCPVISL